MKKSLKILFSKRFAAVGLTCALAFASVSASILAQGDIAEDYAPPNYITAPDEEETAPHPGYYYTPEDELENQYDYTTEQEEKIEENQPILQPPVAPSAFYDVVLHGPGPHVVLPGQNVTLYYDVTGDITVMPGAQLHISEYPTIHNITIHVYGAVYLFDNAYLYNSRLIINDGGVLNMDYSYIDWTTGDAVTINPGGIFNMYDGVISNASGFGVVFAQSFSNAEFNMHGGRIYTSERLRGSGAVSSIGASAGIAPNRINLHGGTLDGGPYLRGRGIHAVSIEAYPNQGTIINMYGPSEIISFNQGVVLDGATTFIMHEDAGSITANGVTRTSQASGGGASLLNGATFIMNGGSFDGNFARRGGGMYIDANSHFELNGGYFLWNNANNGAAIFSRASFNISGNTTFVSNENCGNMSVNEASGGAIHLEFGASSSQSVNITGDVKFHSNGRPGFYRNTQITLGGAIFINGGTLTIDANIDQTDATFDNNQGRHGGAIYAVNANVELLGDTLFNWNQSTMDGGAVHLTNSTLTIRDNVTMNNNLSGAIGMVNGSEALLPGNGGAIFATNNSEVDIRGSVLLQGSFAQDIGFYGAYFDSFGGAIYLENHSSLHIDGARFAENGARFGAAIYLADTATATISNASFESGWAIVDGGAIYVEVTSRGGVPYPDLTLGSGVYFVSNRSDAPARPPIATNIERLRSEEVSIAFRNWFEGPVNSFDINIGGEGHQVIVIDKDDDGNVTIHHPDHVWPNHVHDCCDTGEHEIVLSPSPDFPGTSVTPDGVIVNQLPPGWDYTLTDNGDGTVTVVLIPPADASADRDIVIDKGVNGNITFPTIPDHIQNPSAPNRGSDGSYVIQLVPNPDESIDRDDITVNLPPSDGWTYTATPNPDGSWTVTINRPAINVSTDGDDNVTVDVPGNWAGSNVAPGTDADGDYIRVDLFPNGDGPIHEEDIRINLPGDWTYTLRPDDYMPGNWVVIIRRPDEDDGNGNGNGNGSDDDDDDEPSTGGSGNPGNPVDPGNPDDSDNQGDSGDSNNQGTQTPDTDEPGTNDDGNDNNSDTDENGDADTGSNNSNNAADENNDAPNNDADAPAHIESTPDDNADADFDTPADDDQASSAITTPDADNTPSDTNEADVENNTNQNGHANTQQPPVASTPGATLVMSDDGYSWIELDDAGVPLGTWTWNSDEGIWLFDPVVPLAFFAPTDAPLGVASMPQTGVNSNANIWTAAIATSASLAAAAVLAMKKQNKKADEK